MSKTSVEQGENFKKLNGSMQAMVTSFAEGSNSFDNVSELIRSESLLITQHMNQHFQRIEDAKLDDAFLDTLYFADYTCGQNKIVDAHRKTFQWIYETPDSTQSLWSDFAGWLESGSGTYWLESKAGSGKTTLMNYISYNKKTT